MGGLNAETTGWPFGMKVGSILLISESIQERMKCLHVNKIIEPLEGNFGECFIILKY